MLACEKSGQFASLDHTYLFVGYRPVDRIPDDLRVVVCRDYMPNYERWPQFYDFTGWWVLASHKLLFTDQIICLQYDMGPSLPDLAAAVAARFRHNPAAGMIAFNAGYFGPNWMLLLPGFKGMYDKGLAAVGVDPADFQTFNEWPSTQGTAWRAETFIDFMHWFEPMFDVFHEDTFAGHLAERTVKAYLASIGMPEEYMLGAIWHLVSDCHGTGALMGGNRKLYEARNAEFMLTRDKSAG